MEKIEEVIFEQIKDGRHFDQKTAKKIEMLNRRLINIDRRLQPFQRERARIVSEISDLETLLGQIK
jgi:hypothetical protein